MKVPIETEDDKYEWTAWSDKRTYAVNAASAKVSDAWTRWTLVGGTRIVDFSGPGVHRGREDLWRVMTRKKT